MENRSWLLAGAAEADITPRMGTQLAGDIGRRRPAEILVDPIFAKALVLDDGKKKLCVLSLDILTMTREWADRIREGAAKRYGLDPAAVMVHAVQNHAAPTIGHCFFNFDWDYVPKDMAWLRGGDDDYNPFAVERALDAVGRALQDMKRVRVGIASGVENRVAFNRRFVMRDGTAEMGFRGRPVTDVAYNEGPIDPELGVLSLTAESLRPVAVLLHHTCHPVHGYPQRYVTAGWPGAWSQGIRNLYGPGCVPLVINGCCGNVHHCNYLNPQHVDTAERMGQTLTEATVPLIKQLAYQAGSPLDHASRILEIPLRSIPPDQLESAAKLLTEHPAPMWRKGLEGTAVEWDWIYAVSRLDLEKLRLRKPTVSYEIQALRVGDFALVGVMGEPFVQGQLRLKMESPAARTFVAHMCNGNMGYVPTPEAIRRGGYETRTANWSKLAPEALDTIVDGSVMLLKDMFKGHGPR